MTVIGVDDTDSSTGGLCTTFVAARIADQLVERGATVERLLLIRCNPAIEHKTRGNAALAVHVNAEPETALGVLDAELDQARTDDPETNPGGVVLPGSAADVQPSVADFARVGVRDRHKIESARDLADRVAYGTIERGNGRGLIGALAAVGAWRAFDDWTYECIAYRERERWGTDRSVEAETVRTAARNAYPGAWDTVDATSGYPVCVPRTPCPVLHAIRGDDRAVVERVSRQIDSEPVAHRATFVTNQGTDAHLHSVASTTAVRDGRSYRLTATVSSPPETRAGGHVFVTIRDSDGELDCVAFEPTKRFRDRVRHLRPGDRVTVCGEVTSGTLKLEKFALRDRVEVVQENPVCPGCERTMESAGVDQGYRCRRCGTVADSQSERAIERAIEPGWYEVPPVARRHIAKPLIRGEFEGPVHPER